MKMKKYRLYFSVGITKGDSDYLYSWTKMK